jgi:DNA replication protein DnaC
VRSLPDLAPHGRGAERQALGEGVRRERLVQRGRRAGDLLDHEVQAVEQRRLQGRLRFAKLPARKTLEQFDFAAQPNLDRRLVEDLATLRFIEERANALLIGPPGVGKTMLATILGPARSRPATASTTPPPPTSSPAPPRPRSKAAGPR